MKTVLARLLDKRDGQALVEYVLIIALIAVVVVAGLKLLGSNINSEFSNIVSNL